jgi:hypothetical protein
MYNLRYHVASLVAVFLSLAVGLLLGTVVAERGMITDQSSALVADLQARFNEIDEANEELRLGLARDRTFAEDAAEALTAGRLEGMHVAVLVGAGRSDGRSAVEEAVAEAGGTTVMAPMSVPGLGLGTSEPEGLAGYFHARDIEMASPGEDLWDQVAIALVDEWRSGGEQPLTALLVEAQLLGPIESADGTATIDAVVVMTADGEECDPFGLALARAMADAGGVGVAAEAATSSGVVAAACADEGLPAVAHVNTAQGRVSLVWILGGRAHGYFGAGDGADGYYPPLSPTD